MFIVKLSPILLGGLIISIHIMNLESRLNTIFEDPRLDGEDVENSKSQIIYSLVPEVMWDNLLPILIEMLKHRSKKPYWNIITEVLYYASNDNRPMPINEIIALLFVCSAEKDGIQDGNLVWSITHKLKGVSYNSDYEPVDDPAVWILIQEFSSKMKNES
jgi:hypothetical protein